MSERLVAGFGAFGIGAALTWLAIVVGYRWRLLDLPTPIKPHLRAVPYTGGTAVAAVVLATALLLGLNTLALTVLLVWAIGVIDDFRSLRPLTKLALESVALSVWVVSLDVTLPVFVIAVAGGVILINAFNVIDGLDGLAGGCAIAPILALATVTGTTGSLAAAASGAIAGFLVFNRHPARVFLGDEGSLVIGLVIWALVTLAEGDSSAAQGVTAWVLLWSFPIINAAFVVGFRLRRGRSILRGDRSHLYDYLRERVGLSSTLLACWGVAALGAVLALATGVLRPSP
jgi:UDP-N-acetylmuramyl pentapeptide phosphotransferase/UDP-N-acetylglucosamine-1-phosphate transferase